MDLTTDSLCCSILLHFQLKFPWIVLKVATVSMTLIINCHRLPIWLRIWLDYIEISTDWLQFQDTSMYLKSFSCCQGKWDIKRVYLFTLIVSLMFMFLFLLLFIILSSTAIWESSYKPWTICRKSGEAIRYDSYPC